ncbi:MAG: CotH kinase family protein [Christensenellales bacterium]
MKKWLGGLLLLLLSACALGAQADIVISEIMAMNGVYTAGHAYDWVELHNRGNSRVNLAGWGLSDDEAQPFRFVFPEGTALKAEGYLVINCVGEEAAPASGAPFKLSGEGERLLLTAPEGRRAQTLDYPAQYGNISCGPVDGRLLFFERATPGKPNPEEGFSARCEAPVLTAGGFYRGAAEVTLTAQEGALIRYTLDGSEPGKDATLYRAPLSFKKTTVLRARAFKAGLLPSQSVAATYVVDDPAPCAVVSLIGDPADLFGAKAGALVKGTGSVPNYDKELEYPVHIEYFDEKGERLICQEGTFTASGHSARVNAQKSIALYARAAYGPDSFLFNPFPDRRYPAYKSLLLRSANSDANSTRLRDPVISSAAKGLGLLYQDARPVIVYINGDYWGHYNLREKINKYFVAAWEGVTREKDIDNIDILARTGTDDYVQNGSNKDWLDLMAFCRDHDLNQPENLRYVAQRLDIDNFFRHSIFEMIIGNYDMTNVRVYRVPGGKWKYLLFDVEAGFLGLEAEPINYYIKPKTAKRAMFQHVHLAALLEVPAMRSRFLSLFGEILQSQFLWPDMAARFLRWETALEPILPRHFARWPRGLNEEDWRTNVAAVKYYARVRPLKVIDHICRAMKVTGDERLQYFAGAEAALREANRGP